jgi:hypothetical protein
MTSIEIGICVRTPYASREVANQKIATIKRGRARNISNPTSTRQYNVRHCDICKMWHLSARNGKGLAHMKIEHCRSCNAPIIWCKTKNGRAIPLDSEETGSGSFFLDENTMTAFYGRGARTKGYVSHFATCPQHEQWRKE